MPETVNVVRRGTNVIEVLVCRKEHEMYQSATSYEVTDDIDFSAFPRDALEAHSIINRSSQGVEVTKQRKKKTKFRPQP